MVVLVLLVVGGCIFNPDKDEGEEQDLLATPAGTLEQLETAYQRKDIDLYLETLADTFVFHFMPRDVDVWPEPTWGKTEEEASHRNMFRTVHHIELAMVGESATKTRDDPETWVLYKEYDLLLYLTEDELAASPAYGWAEFIIVKEEDEWFRIVDWYDLEQQP